MHYKNGRPARDGDHVVARVGEAIVSGVVVNLNPGTCCNCDLKVIVAEGGVHQITCQNLSDMLRADDAMYGFVDRAPVANADFVAQKPS